MIRAAAAVPARAELLLVEREDVIARYTPLLHNYRVATTTQIKAAVEYIRRSPPSLVITELDLEDGSGIEICRTAKTLQTPPSVLVTTPTPEQVPDALAAGCDGVLLKPFQPNLLLTRASRLLRAHSTELRVRSARFMGKSSHLSERIEHLRKGTNQVWPSSYCPYCSHAGVTSFDHGATRRDWYACLSCRKVWLAKRLT